MTATHNLNPESKNAVRFLFFAKLLTMWTSLNLKNYFCKNFGESHKLLGPT
jgi:hypothetical protein